MFAWLKQLFTNPKMIIQTAVDALDLLVPTLGAEIAKVEAVFNSKTPIEKAQWVIDRVQFFLRGKFGLDTPNV